MPGKETSESACSVWMPVHGEEQQGYRGGQQYFIWHSVSAFASSISLQIEM
jgi:hypothetical protein